MASKRDTKIHPTVGHKKTSVVHSKGHKPGPTAASVRATARAALRTVKKHLETVANFVNLDAANYARFMEQLSLSDEEINTIYQINEAVEENFLDIYRLIPNIKDKETQRLIAPLIALQEKYFTQLGQLDYKSDDLDEKIKALSSDYKNKFAMEVEASIKELEKTNPKQIGALHKLTEINFQIIEAFESNMLDLTKAKSMTKNIYRNVICCAALACLGVTLLVIGCSILVALAHPVVPTALAAGLLLVIFGDITFVSGSMLAACTLNYKINAPKLTEKYKESRKDVLDIMQTSLYATCVSLRNFITANEPKLKVS